MKNKILWLFLIAVTGICCLFYACKSQEPPSLNAPENIRVENGFLVWDKVENAEKYIVYYNNKEHETVNNFFDLATITEVGEYIIEILAVGDGNRWTDSSWSTYNYTLNHIEDSPTVPSHPTENLAYTLLEDKSGYEVSKGSADLTGIIVIPSTYNGLPVKQIAEKAFSYFQGFDAIPNTKTTGVVIPDTVETISSYAFFKCTALNYVNIPKNLVCISASAFQNCTSLQKITFNEGLVKIEQNAFKGASNLKEFNLPSTLTTLQSGAFTDTAWLNESPDGDVVKDGIYVRHKGTSGDTLNVTGCRLIADEALSGKNFTEVTISDGIAIGNSVLLGTRQLRKVTLPKDLKKLPYATFYGSAIQTIQLPDGLNEIGEYAFFSSGLTEIELPSSLKKICSQAFQQSKLTNIYIPSGVEIGTNAFNSCALLESVIIQGSEKIFDDAFYSCQKLSTANLLGKTVDIGAEAFRNCIALEHLQLPENLQIIGNDCFHNCKNLTSVKLPDSLKTIGKNAFDSSGLESLTLNKNLEEIQDSAFNKCEALTAIDFANCKAKIHSTAFSRIGVTEITIPDYVNFDSESAGFFSHCANLKKATIGAIKKIPNSFLLQCTALENVVFSEGTTEIGQTAFAFCRSITILDFPTSLEKIDSAAFSQCAGLTRVTLPENLTSVSNGFSNCTNLTEVVLNKKLVPSIADFLKKTASITKIYFNGDKTDWDNCLPKDYTLPESVTVYFYTNNDTAPTDGNRYWHYLSDKDIEILN